MPSKIETIMTADASGAELVSFAKDAAERLYRERLTRTQIRNIFTEVRQIEDMWPNDETGAMLRLNMLKPKLFYQKNRKKEVAYLENVLSQAITFVESAEGKLRKERFQRFVYLFEAILAYHRGK